MCHCCPAAVFVWAITTLLHGTHGDQAMLSCTPEDITDVCCQLLGEQQCPGLVWCRKYTVCLLRDGLDLLSGDGRTWYVSVSDHQIQNLSEPSGCGSKSQPCYHLSSLTHKLKDGDTVMLTAESNAGKSEKISFSDGSEQIEFFICSVFLHSCCMNQTNHHFSCSIQTQ